VCFCSDLADVNIQSTVGKFMMSHIGLC